MGPQRKGCEGMEPHKKTFKELHGLWNSLQKGTFPLWPHSLLILLSFTMCPQAQQTTNMPTLLLKKKYF